MFIPNPRSLLFPQVSFLFTKDEFFCDRVKMNQVHGNRIVIVTDPRQDIGEADGMVTKEKNLTLSVSVADCGNLYFFDPLVQVIGICHAGWRGTAKGIVSNIILAMKECGSQPENIYVFAGPAICGSCHQFTKQTDGLFDDTYYENGLLNLRSVWRDQLLEGGLSLDNIVISPICTMCESDFYSFKRDATEKRMIGTLCLND